MQIKKTGTLYVVATPIGNLKDITLRAIEILKVVDKIAAEDTRHADALLKHYSIQKPSFSLHEFNEYKRIEAVIADLQNGKSIALISDAGTPLISDPGFQLVKAAQHANINVVPIPGACAAIAALSVSGLPTDQFFFAGFLPSKQNSRKVILQSLAREKSTLIFYEAPHRLLVTLEDMMDVFGNEREVVVARELTKIHESLVTGKLQEAFSYFEAHLEEQRGEIVILLAGFVAQPLPEIQSETETILRILLNELSLKQAVAIAAKITGERKNMLYKLAIQTTDTKEQVKNKTKLKE